MKLSLNWANWYSNVDLKKPGIDELVERIGLQLGAVEEVESLAEKYEGIVVVRVVSCTKHPNADKLSVCLIDDNKAVTSVKRNKDGLVELVCGAPNVRAGMHAVWIPPGLTVPATRDKEPLVLDAREIRGVVSNGMLASAAELGFSDDHTGIIEVTEEDVYPGQSIIELYKLDDFVIDIENKMFTHRPDCFGQLGLARELVAIQGECFQSPDWYLNVPKAKEVSSELPLEIRNSQKKLVPRFMAATIKGADVKPSPVWLQSYLARVGIRPINNIVDTTNYMMMLTAQPLHAYDYDKVKAKTKAKDKAVLGTRLSRKGDTLVLLGGKQVEFEDGAILITTDEEAIGAGGVMGGADTEVDETTKDIILEVATFDMYSTRRTMMKYGLFTDAATRFTKGQSPFQNDRVLHKAVSMINDLAGGEMVGLIDDKVRLLAPKKVKVTPEFINRRLGTSLSGEEMMRILQNAEFEVFFNRALEVVPPFWRTDIHIPEDVVEEVGRLFGYEHLPMELPKRDLTPARQDELLAVKRQVRHVLAAAGANEALTYSFVHGDLLKKVGQDKDRAFQLANALSPDLQYYRLSLTPSLLAHVHANIKSGYDHFALFEINKTHQKGLLDGEKLPREQERVALVFAASGEANQQFGYAPYYQVQKYLRHLMTDFGIEFDLVSVDDAKQATAGLQQTLTPFEPSRSALVMSGGTPIGVAGEYRTRVRQNLKLPSFCAGFELDINRIAKLRQKRSAYQKISRYPFVQQDISLKLPAKVRYGDLESTVREAITRNAPANNTFTLEPLDIFQREGDTAHKQIAFRLKLASHERTLTAQEVNDLLDAVAAAAHKAHRAIRL